MIIPLHDGPVRQGPRDLDVSATRGRHMCVLFSDTREPWLIQGPNADESHAVGGQDPPDFPERSYTIRGCWHVMENRHTRACVEALGLKGQIRRVALDPMRPQRPRREAKRLRPKM